MKKRTAPKGQGSSRKEGVTVDHKFAGDYCSYANCIPYNRPAEMQKGIAATLAMRENEKRYRAGMEPVYSLESMQASQKAYKYRRDREYGGASTFEGGEVFSDGRK